MIVCSAITMSLSLGATRWNPSSTIRLRYEADTTASVGALELRLGLDLADRPARWQELSYLSIKRCTELLITAGFEHTAVGVLPSSDTSDPVLLHWSRTCQPVGIDGAQRTALVTCLDLASFRQVIHRLSNTRTVDERRSLFTGTVGEDGLGSDDDLLQAFTRAWAVYLSRGRKALLELGDRVVVAPELAGVQIGPDGLAFKTRIEQSLEHAYAISANRREEFFEEIGVEIEADADVTVILTWKRIWQHGVADVLAASWPRAAKQKCRSDGGRSPS